MTTRKWIGRIIWFTGAILVFSMMPSEPFSWDSVGHVISMAIALMMVSCGSSIIDCARFGRWPWE